VVEDYDMHVARHLVRASTSGSTHPSRRWKPAGPVGKKQPSMGFRT
jgi:hypothetical protein